MLGPESVGRAFETWSAGFGSAMALEATMFAPFNLVSFRLIPSALRPLAAAMMSASYTVLLSAMC